jgi:membrane protease YdiL (CAAX protease family)
MSFKSSLNKLIKWNPQKDVIIGFTIGLIILLLSVSMILLKNYTLINIVIRDVVMILIVGIAFPLYRINRQNNFKDYGINLKKWYLFLPINFILGFFLLLMFLKESPLPNNFSFNQVIIWKIVYIMLAGIFEIVVFYSFIRTIIERSFGIIPAVIITALFYSFHHAGFQPEFGKLLFVGILYASVYRIGNSALLIFPFFWGVGACYDVLIQSTEVLEIIYPEIRSIIILIGIIIIVAYLLKTKSVRTSSNSA